MKVLIVENDPNRGRVWRSHIARLGASVAVVAGQSEAVDALSCDSYDIVILNLDLGEGSAMAVADYASYRRPDCKVIFVTAKSFFSDGSIFSYMSNACALIPAAMPPEDMAALVEHHGR
jgi:DNA-binding response OmpR family regulator